jgi:[ribosomal protein S5]-alanine N-acetyltransferase
MIETYRLIIMPLSGEQLKKYANSPDELATDLGLVPSQVLMGEEVKDAIRNDLLANVTDVTKDPSFYTMWLVIEKNSKAIVGGICFHGEPDENGEVEIGYGIDELYHNRGYMSETIDGIIQWIVENKKVKIIRAETECNNISSIRVLEKNGFKISQQIDNILILRLQIKEKQRGL